MEDYVIYKRDDEIDKKKKWKYETLYKVNQIDNDQEWTVGYDPKKNIVTKIWGVVDGNLQIEEYTPEAKAGRSNFEQALQEINQEYEKKIRKGYHTPEDEKPELGEPMLAGKFNEVREKIVYPVALSLKLDGMRMLIREERGEIKYRSRGNIEKNHFGEFFDKDISLLLSYLPDGVELDGELYSFDQKFSKIISIAKKEIHRSKADDDEMKKELYFCIFDVNMKGPYDYRFYELAKAFRGYSSELKKKKGKLVLLNNFFAYSEEDVDTFHEYAVKGGYEGTMVKKIFFDENTTDYKKMIGRWNESKYVPGKRTNIFKLKPFEDAEGIIVDIVGCKKGSKHEKLGKFVIKMENGKLFDCVPKATHAEREEYLKNKKKYIGKKYTYRFDGIGSKGLPRDPRGIRFRDYE